MPTWSRPVFDVTFVKIDELTTMNSEQDPPEASIVLRVNAESEVDAANVARRILPRMFPGINADQYATLFSTRATCPYCKRT